MNNWKHFHGIVHELKIKDKTALLPLLTPACSRHTFLSQQLWYCWPTRDWVQSWGSTITELLCVKIRLPNTSSPAVINLIQYDSLTCFRAAIDLCSPPPSLLTQRWIGSPINCIPINHSSPMFVCRSLWYVVFLPFYFSCRLIWNACSRSPLATVMCLTAP